MRKGFTLLEVLVTIAIIGVLALLLTPWLSCLFQKSAVARATRNVSIAAYMVEQYKLDHTLPPDSLEQAFNAYGTPMPKGLIYCSAYYYDPDKGHGNDCDFYDEENPGNSNPGEKTGTAGLGYIVRTEGNLSPTCCQVDFIWAPGGPSVTVVKTGEWTGRLPGRMTRRTK